MSRRFFRKMISTSMISYLAMISAATLVWSGELNAATSSVWKTGPVDAVADKVVADKAKVDSDKADDDANKAKTNSDNAKRYAATAKALADQAKIDMYIARTNANKAQANADSSKTANARAAAARAKTEADKAEVDAAKAKTEADKAKVAADNAFNAYSTALENKSRANAVAERAKAVSDKSAADKAKADADKAKAELTASQNCNWVKDAVALEAQKPSEPNSSIKVCSPGDIAEYQARYNQCITAVDNTCKANSQTLLSRSINVRKIVVANTQGGDSEGAVKLTCDQEEKGKCNSANIKQVFDCTTAAEQKYRDQLNNFNKYKTQSDAYNVKGYPAKYANYNDCVKKEAERILSTK